MVCSNVLHVASSYSSDWDEHREMKCFWTLLSVNSYSDFKGNIFCYYEMQAHTSKYPAFGQYRSDCLKRVCMETKFCRVSKKNCCPLRRLSLRFFFFLVIQESENRSNRESLWLMPREPPDPTPISIMPLSDWESLCLMNPLILLSFQEAQCCSDETPRAVCIVEGDVF